MDFESVNRINAALSRLAAEGYEKGSLFKLVFPRIESNFYGEFDIKETPPGSDHYRLVYKHQFESSTPIFTEAQLNAIASSIEMGLHHILAQQDDRGLTNLFFSPWTDAQTRETTYESLINTFGNDACEKNPDYPALTIKDGIIRLLNQCSSKLITPNYTDDFNQFRIRISESKNQISPQLSELISQDALNNIFDYFLEPREWDARGAQLKQIEDLGPGQALRLAKEDTGLPRTFNIIRNEDGEFQLILETKSKLADDTKSKLPNISGANKKGKPAWRIDGKEIEYFNLVARLGTASLPTLQLEVDLSKKLASEEVNLNLMGQTFTSAKGEEKVSIYSVKTLGSLDTLHTFKMSSQQQDQLILDLLNGVKRFHDRDYVHQDLKPQNLLATGNDAVGYHLKLTDYGNSKRQNEDSVYAASTIGYQPPELNYLYSDPRLNGDYYNKGNDAVNSLGYKMYTNMVFDIDRVQVENADKSIDMWACGIIIYEIRHGRKPTMDDMPEIENDPLLRHLLAPRDQRIEIDQALAIYKDKEKRDAVVMLSPEQLALDSERINPAKAAKGKMIFQGPGTAHDHYHKLILQIFDQAKQDINLPEDKAKSIWHELNALKATFPDNKHPVSQLCDYYLNKLLEAFPDATSKYNPDLEIFKRYLVAVEKGLHASQWKCEENPSLVYYTSDLKDLTENVLQNIQQDQPIDEDKINNIIKLADEISKDEDIKAYVEPQAIKDWMKNKDEKSSKLKI